MLRDINESGLDLIKSFEGLQDGDPSTVNLDPYLDPIEIWTIGWGHAIRDGSKFLRGRENRSRARALYPDGINLSQAAALLIADVLDKCRDVQALLTVDMNDNQYAAVVSFAYNVGVENLRRSTLLRLINEEAFDDASREFPKWNKAGGKVLAGLTRRRKAEAALFMTI